MSPYRKSLAILIFMLASLFLLYEMALQVLPSILSAPLMEELNIGPGTFGLMASLYFYSYTIMQVPAGLLLDRFGPRMLISFAVLICSIGILLFGVTSSVETAAFGRFLMGFGSAFAFIGVLTVAALWFHPRHFAFLVGIAQLLAALGAFSGEVALSKVADTLGGIRSSWRVMMIMLGILGLILTFFSFLIIRDQPNKIRLPFAGRLHLFRDLKEIIKEKQTWWILLYAFCGWGPITLFAALWGVPYLMVRYSIPETLAALACSVIWIGIAVAAPIIGWLSDRFSRRRDLLIISAGLGLICSLSVIYISWIPFWFMFLLLFGIGVAGAGQILTFALVRDINRPAITSTAVALNNMGVVAGGVVFQPLVGFLLQIGDHSYVSSGAVVYPESAYHFGLIMMPLCFLTGLFVSWFCIKETHGKPRHLTL